ncbi:MAG TPA: YihY/virulence factor BrkB family protein [Polyangiales bacterium]
MAQNPKVVPALASFVRNLSSFALRVLRGFIANGGEVMASAIAYNGLLSVLPLFMLATAVFARFVDRESFIEVVTRELHLLIPSGSAKPVIDAFVAALEVPYSGGVVGFGTLLVFSTLAFRTLQHAMDVIFAHRHEVHSRRTLLQSVLISLGFVLAIGVASLLETVTLLSLGAVPFLANRLPAWTSLMGFVGTVLALSAIYVVMPPGKGHVRAAFVGGLSAGLVLRGVQSVLVWYLQNVSSVGVIYGSLAAVIVVLFSIELGAIIVLLGAQVIAEIEQSWNNGRRWYQAPDKPSGK